MASGLRGRLARSILSVSVALPLVVSAAGATPVAASPSACGSAEPVIWVLPLMSQPQTFNLGESRVFTLFVQNRTSCDLPWRASTFITSTSGHVWGDVPGGPLGGPGTGEMTAETTFTVTAPQSFSSRADFYIRVYAGATYRAYHWTFRMSD